MRRIVEGAAAVAGALIVRTFVSAAAAHRLGLSVFDASTWARWDSGLYADIAQHGYVLGRCGVLFPTGPYGPNDWCGNTGWFPLYPLLVRAGIALGLGVGSSGRLVSLLFFAATLTVVWFGFLERLSRPRAYPLLLLVAFFPGSVYYGAMFPLSLTVFGCVSALALLDRGRPGLAGAAAALGAAAYPPVALVAIVVVVVVWRSARARWWRDGIAFAAPILLTEMAVVAMFRAWTGRGDAFFLVQHKYDFSTRTALRVYVDRFSSLGNLSAERADAPALQTVLVLALIAATAFVLVRHRHRLTTLEAAAGLLAVALWIVPLALGGQLSIYRSEALLVPVVVLLRRLPAVVAAGFAAVAAGLAVAMDYLFFVNYLI